MVTHSINPRVLMTLTEERTRQSGYRGESIVPCLAVDASREDTHSANLELRRSWSDSTQGRERVPGVAPTPAQRTGHQRRTLQRRSEDRFGEGRATEECWFSRGTEDDETEEG